MKSMYGRQFATMTVMVLLSFLMLGASFATLSYQYTIQEKRDSMSRSAHIIASYTSSYINANGEYAWQEPDFQAQLNVLALATDTHVMVSTAQGVVVYATDGVDELLELEESGYLILLVHDDYDVPRRAKDNFPAFKILLFHFF